MHVAPEADGAGATPFPTDVRERIASALVEPGPDTSRAIRLGPR